MGTLLFDYFRAAMAYMYVIFLFQQPTLNSAQLSRVLCSQEWAVFATPDDKIYFVNQSDQCM